MCRGVPFRPWGFCGEPRRGPGLVGILWGGGHAAQRGSPAARSAWAMPTARRAGQELIAVPATAGDHAGDLTDGQHASSAEYALENCQMQLSRPAPISTNLGSTASACGRDLTMLDTCPNAPQPVLDGWISRGQQPSTFRCPAVYKTAAQPAQQQRRKFDRLTPALLVRCRMDRIEPPVRTDRIVTAAQTWAGKLRCAYRRRMGSPPRAHARPRTGHRSVSLARLGRSRHASGEPRGNPCPPRMRDATWCRPPSPQHLA